MDIVALLELTGEYEIVFEDDDRKFPWAVRELLEIDPENITEAFIDNPLRMGYVGDVHALAKSAERAAKRRIGKAEARAYLSARDVFAAQGVKTTVALMEATVADDPEVKRAEEEYEDVAKTLDQVASVLNALRNRGDMLQMLGAYKRTEIEKFGVSTPSSDLGERAGQLLEAAQADAASQNDQN